MALQFQGITEEDVILGALGVVDLTLVACLVVLVIFSTYSNFVARVDTTVHEDWPSWMTGIDYGELKLKLVASIVAISAIKLLEAYMNIGHETDRELGWRLAFRRFRRRGAAARHRRRGRRRLGQAQARVIRTIGAPGR